VCATGKTLRFTRAPAAWEVVSLRADQGDSTYPLSSMTFQRQFPHRMDEETNMVSNSPDQKCVPCQVSPLRFGVTLPSSPDHLSSSTLIDNRSLMENPVHHETERDFTKGERCMYIFCTIACTDC
jgi:hypothetical protein